MPKLTRRAPKEAEKSEKTESAISDEDLDFKVAYVLKEDPELEDFVISVRSHQGVPGLEGKVDTPGQIERATEVTLGVAGVLGIDNRLTAKPRRRVQRKR